VFYNSLIALAWLTHFDCLERELSPSSRIIDAYTRPPTYRSVDRRSSDSKRRSVDFAQLSGSQDDIQPDDPVFILRRAIAYRNSTSRHRMSAPLDEIALQHLQRDIANSSGDDTSSSIAGGEDKQRQQQLSRQQLIAAQREASRANQRAILSAQANHVRGVDLLLPGNAILRSQRGGGTEDDDRMRYSYVDGAGEAYDISDIVEEEWRSEVPRDKPEDTHAGDLLEGVVGNTNRDGLGAKLERVLSKIKPNSRVAKAPADSEPEPSSAASSTSTSSIYSMDDSQLEANRAAARATSPARSVTPTAAVGRTASPVPASASRSATPTSLTTRNASPAPPPNLHDRQPSIASILSSSSNTTPTRPARSSARSTPLVAVGTARQRPSKPVITKDDFGVGNMLAIIDAAALLGKSAPPEPIDEVEEFLFGRPLSEAEVLHPDIREIYASSFQRLEDMDKVCALTPIHLQAY
jgi:hypothetical protein